MYITRLGQCNVTTATIIQHTIHEYTCTVPVRKTLPFPYPFVQFKRSFIAVPFPFVSVWQRQRTRTNGVPVRIRVRDGISTSASWAATWQDSMAMQRAIARIQRRLGCRRRRARLFSLWRLKVAFGCPVELSWLETTGTRRSFLRRRSLA